MKHGTEYGWADGCTCHACYLAGRIPTLEAADAESGSRLPGLDLPSAASSADTVFNLDALPAVSAPDLRRAA